MRSQSNPVMSILAVALSACCLGCTESPMASVDSSSKGENTGGSTTSNGGSGGAVASGGENSGGVASGGETGKGGQPSSGGVGGLGG